ncbi:MAG TPA: hypothetical protein PK280_12085 [Planctomycetota bacterium]|nr:hypothetical protein [Planctomycetota bacterium]
MFARPFSTLCAVLMGLALASAGLAADGDKPAGDGKGEPKAQTTCPVMGGKINKAIFADHDGKRVYLCCKGCIAEFAKDPAKYIKKLEDEGVVLERTPAAEQKPAGAAAGSGEKTKACCPAGQPAVAKGGCCP